MRCGSSGNVACRVLDRHSTGNRLPVAFDGLKLRLRGNRVARHPRATFHVLVERNQPCANLIAILIASVSKHRIDQFRLGGNPVATRLTQAATWLAVCLTATGLATGCKSPSMGWNWRLRGNRVARHPRATFSVLAERNQPCANLIAVLTASVSRRRIDQYRLGGNPVATRLTSGV